MRDVLPALAVIPLMRLVSLAMPLGNLAAVDRLLILGACLLLSTLLTARLLRVTPAQLGLEVGRGRDRRPSPPPASRSA